MPGSLRIRLTQEEKQQLYLLSNQAQTPRRTKTRIEILKLSDRGWKVEQIALELTCSPATVRRTIARWINQDKEGLFDAPRRGRTRKWQKEDLEFLEKCLELEPRTYNSRQLSELLKQERQVELSAERVRKILKKKEWKWKRTKVSLKGKQNSLIKARKSADLERLKLFEREGLRRLKYLDESGFCLWSPVSYTSVKKGEQKEIKQTKRRGVRLSVLGIFEENNSFEYGLVLGEIKSDTYLKMIDWQAEQAQEHFRKTREITVIVQDNYTVHKSHKVKDKEPEWRSKGLEFFFLSSYSPELNQIEPEWHQLKTHELAGRMFEDEYDLALAVMEGIEERSQKNNCTCQRFRFN